MMKFGVLRNIAGNVEALKSADRQFDKIGVDIKFTLGQIVGIYPYVDECVDFLISRKYLGIRLPVEDEFVGECEFKAWSKTHLKAALQFARGRTSKASVRFLRELPTNVEINGVGFEGFASEDGFIYEPQQAKIAFEKWKQSNVLHAGEPDPCVWHESLNRTLLQSGSNEINSHGRVLISTGGVGSIYDGSLNTRKPAAIVFDDAGRIVHLLRPICNVHKVFSDLRAIKYPLLSMAFLERHEYELWRNPPA